MVELLFDTCVLIDHLRGIAEATRMVKMVKEGSIIGYISTLTEAELFAGKDSDDSGKRTMLIDLLSIFEKLDINEGIARVAGDFKRKYGITLADAIIAATAFMLRCKVATQNTKDFRIVKEIEVEKPY